MQSTTRFGDYEILEKLGEGGMGEVWRARDPNLNRFVAVKILPAGVAAEPSRRARFEQEARALAALNHQEILAVYGAGATDGRAWIASELVSGESLRAVIERGRLPLRRIIDIAVQIAEAMAAAHAAGIVHRDLKPENIMIAEGGRVKVLDFGLAKQTLAASADTATMALSQPGTVLGTVGYMSPEQVRGEPVDARSDIFSFGAVLYEMISGRRAFQAPSSVETMNAILRDDPADLLAEKPPPPGALAIIVSRCLEKRPDQRFQSAADLAFALRSVTTASSGSGTHAPVKPAQRARWVWLALAAAAAIVLFIAGFLLAARFQHREPPRFQRITFRKGLVISARFTADGHDVIYSAQWDSGPTHTYLTTPGNPESRDLDLPENGILEAVSSKNDVAFIHGPFLPDGTGTLARSSVSGGQMRPWLDGVLLADWAPDGSSMAVLRSVNGRFRLEYPIGTTLLDNLPYPLWAVRVSRDGSLVAFVAFYEGSALGLSVIDKAGHRKFIGPVSDQLPNNTDLMLCWSPDGREIWYRSFDPKEWGTIYAMDLKGRRRVLLRIPGHAVIYDVAQDGRILLRTDSRQLGILARAPGDTQDRDLSCLDMSSLGGISADGRVITAVVLGEGGGPKGSIYLRKTDGSPPVRLGDGHMWALSPDGEWVSAYTSTDAGTRRYVLLPTGAGEERVVDIPALRGVNVIFGWSADDVTMFVHGPGRSGWQNFIWNSQSGALSPVGPSGVGDSRPFVSPDRRQILTQGPDTRWWVYRIDGSQQIVNGLSEHDVPLGWRADNRSIYVAMHHDDNRTMMISTIDIVTGERKPFNEIRPTRPVDQITSAMITPDGRAYAYNFLVKTSELYVADGVR